MKEHFLQRIFGEKPSPVFFTEKFCIAIYYADLFICLQYSYRLFEIRGCDFVIRIKRQNDRRLRLADTVITSRCESLVRCMKDSYFGMVYVFENFNGLWIRRTIINNDNFEILEGLVQNRIYSFMNILPMIEARYYDAYVRHRIQPMFRLLRSKTEKSRAGFTTHSITK